MTDLYPVGSCCSIPLSQDKLIYHQTMTPAWLEGFASYIDSSHSTTADLITFNAGKVSNAALLKIPLIASDILTDCVPLTVEITVANDVRIGGRGYDSDIRYGLSDGINFIGFEAPDRRTYASQSPCYGIEGTSGKFLKKINYKNTKFPKVNKYSYYPGRFLFTFKLDQRWGSCYTAQDHGFEKTTGYINRLKVSKGLTLEVYKTDKNERVGIKFIKVAITQDSSCSL